LRDNELRKAFSMA